jgi:hypothetical protein
MRAVAVAAGLVLLLMGSTVGVGNAEDVDTAGEAVAAVPSTDWFVEDAKRFRREQGFSQDEGLIRSLLVATSEPRDEEFGTPLTDAEAALMHRRADIQVELQGVRDYGQAHPAAWGGLWLTAPTGSTLEHAIAVNVGIVGDPAAHRKAIEALLPDGADLTIHQVKYTHQQLTDAHEPLRQDAFTWFPDRGIQLNSVDTNTIDNRLDVYVSTLSPTIDAAIKGRYGGDMVRVFTGGEMHPDACTRLDCGPPWKGGVKIVRVHADGTENWCTLGFIVRKSVSGGYAYAAWTAGHCGTGTWRQGTRSGDVIGKSTWKNGSPSYADVQLIPIAAANRSNKIIDDTANCSGCTLRPFTGAAQQGFNGDDLGDTVCNNGYATGHTCGVIRSTNVDNFEYPSGTILSNQRRATYVRAGGDSGGPVFTTKGSVAAGSHVHYQTFSGDPYKYPVYSHVFEMSVLSQYYVYNGS